MTRDEIQRSGNGIALPVTSSDGPVPARESGVPARPPGRGRALPIAILVLAVAFGGAARSLRTGLGLPYLHHWDEPQIAGTALRMMTTGDFNPHNFSYPTLTTYACVLVDVAHYYRLMATPAGADEPLESPAQLQAGDGSGFSWSVSHPSFYRVDRMLVALLGVGSILLVFDVGRRLGAARAGDVAGGDLAAGAFAAAILAASPLHVAHSAFVTTDVPMAFFFLLAARQSLVYLESPGGATLAAALAAAGAAIGTKYNALPVLAAPLLAVAATPRARRPPFTALLCLAIPPALFLATNPYVVADFGSFLRDSGYEVRHYKVLGHPGANVEPGIPHAWRAVGHFRASLSTPILALALAGLVLGHVARPARAAVVFVPALLYFALLVEQRVCFDRNYLACIAFLTIGAGVAIGAGGRSLAARIRRRAPGAPADALVLPGTLLAIALCLHPSRTFESARAVRDARDSRTVAIDRVRELLRAAPAAKVGIAEQLRIHPLDLARLPSPAATFDQRSATLASERFDLLLMARLDEATPSAATPSGAGEGLPIEATIPGGPIPARGPIADPEVTIRRTEGARPWIVSRDVAALPDQKKEGFVSDVATSGHAVLRQLGLAIPPEATRLVLWTQGRHPGIERWRQLDLKVVAGEAVELAPVGREGTTLVLALPAGLRTLDQLTIDSRTYVPADGGLPRGIEISTITIQ